MKIPIELNFVDGDTFLNFWDANHGNDVVCKIVNGKIVLDTYSHEEGEEDKHSTVITLSEFVELVKKNASIP